MAIGLFVLSTNVTGYVGEKTEQHTMYNLLGQS